MSVDDRIVSMQFDNSRFESKLAETVKSLDKLRQSLDFSNSKRSFTELDAASKAFNMGNMHTVVDGVSAKFVALSTIAITALSTITSRAISAGTAFVKSFTFDPIQQGFEEFETNMNSIQTILANTDSKGSTLEDVNAALLQLNKYSDQTIYNFSQMARNIGTFTAAGVDLETSVGAIKGIANLAAISGSNSEQASTAMYQLSQALASGTVKLMDWNSVVNAGMGGEVFQKALFETGKAMGTLADVPLGMSFKEWKDSGVSFRETLQDGWITAEVLTNTLKGFTGDLTEAQVLSLGYTKEQAAEILRLGKIGKAAATEVKTLTQLIGTVKESVASGWTQTFQTLIGDFGESKELFTSIGNSIGEFVGKSADARNTMLKTWKDFGARTTLIEGFKDVIKGIGSVLRPIKDAFREIFPAQTAENLIVMTRNFADFAESLKIGADTASNIKSVFRGLFAILEIGWTVFKELLGVVGDVISALSPAGSGIFDFAAKTGDTLTELNEALVAGGGIHDFFERIGDSISKAVGFIVNIKEHLTDFFTDVKDSSVLEAVIDRVESRFENLIGLLEGIEAAWEWVKEAFAKVGDFLEPVWEYIRDWFGSLGDKLADAINPDDFDNAVDAVNVGLLGAIALILRKFLKGGLKIDIGGGIADNIKDALNGVTDTLSAMQANLKANTLLKIAAAMAILTASIVALSLIDSAALTKALLAMSVGFAQLVGVMSLLSSSIGSIAGAARIGIAAGALIGLAVAVGILSIAIKNLSTLEWGELATGLVGVGGGLAILVAATSLITANTAGLISAGIAMSAIAVALILLSKAVKEFAEMEWESMAQGLVGISGGLIAITAAMNLMPSNTLLSGLGFIAVAAGLIVLAEAVERFSRFSWSEMGKGLVGIAGGLLIVAGAMNLMPLNLPITAVGVLILSAALLVMAEAIKRMGENDLGVLAKGIGAFAAILLILVVAMNAMTTALPGAAATLVVAAALVVLTSVIKELGNLSIAQLATGLGAIAAAFIVLGLAALVMQPVVPTLLALGIAVGVVGVAFALFGAGAILVAKAFEIMATSGAKGAKGIVAAIAVFATAMTTIERAVFTAIVKLIEDFLNAIPLLVKLLTAIIDALLDTVIKEVPKIAKALSVIITEWLRLVRDKVPDIIETGILVIMSFLKGIRDNIGEIVTVVAEIVTNFLDALAEKVPDIVDSIYNLYVTILTEVAEKVGKLAATLFPTVAEAFIRGFIEGLNEFAPGIFTWFAALPGKIITALGDLQGKLIPKGIALIAGFIAGLVVKSVQIMSWFLSLPGKILSWIGNTAPTLIPKGISLIGGFLTGIFTKALELLSWFASLPGKILGWIGDVAETLKNKGISLIGGLSRGIVERIRDLITWFKDLPDKILDWVGDISDVLKDVGFKVIDGLWEGMKDAWDKVTGWLSDLNPAKHFNDINPFKGHAVKNLVSTGAAVMTGLKTGMEEGWDGVASWLSTLDPSNAISVDKIANTLSGISDKIQDLDNFNPVITPVLDLTKVQAQSGAIAGYLGATTLSPEVSAAQARFIASTAGAGRETTELEEVASREVKFEQNNYSPSALTVNDIYRNTKSQIALAKEELGIK